MKKYLCMHGLHYYGSYHLTNVLLQCGPTKEFFSWGGGFICFLVYRKDVSNPRHMTSEACEHVYGGYCMVNCEISVRGMMQLKNRG